MRPSALAAGIYLGRPERRRVAGALILCRTSYAPLERLPEHAHDASYLCLALAGEFHERSGRSEERVAVGAAVLHRAGERHADRFGAQAASCLNVSFEPAWSERFGPWFAGEGPARYAPAGAVGGLARRLAREFDETDEASALALEGLALELAAFFARAARIERAAPRWLDAAVERLRAEPPPSLSELARAADVHPATLVRTFRRFHGCSPGEYRRRCRVERACEDLRRGDAPLAEVAARAGFADQSHLTRALRAAIGLSPAAYRRRARGG